MVQDTKHKETNRHLGLASLVQKWTVALWAREPAGFVSQVQGSGNRGTQLAGANTLALRITSVQPKAKQALPEMTRDVQALAWGIRAYFTKQIQETCCSIRGQDCALCSSGSGSSTCPASESGRSEPPSKMPAGQLSVSRLLDLRRLVMQRHAEPQFQCTRQMHAATLRITARHLLHAQGGKKLKQLHDLLLLDRK